MNVQIVLSDSDPVRVEAHSPFHINIITILAQKGKFLFYQRPQSCTKSPHQSLKGKNASCFRSIRVSGRAHYLTYFKPKDSGCFKPVSMADGTNSI